ncbi:MAG TPA: ATP-binding protein [Gemmatimonadaceae bacterium]
MALLLAPFAEAQSQGRLVRRIAEEKELIPPVWAIGQDRSGFLWIGTQGGLLRYDGSSLQRWNTQSGPVAIVSLDFHSDGTVAAVSETGEIFEIRGTVIHALKAPGEPGPRMLHMVAYATDGALWAVRERGLWRRNTAGEWARVPLSGEPDERPLLVRRDVRDGVLISTNRSVWHVGSDARARRVLQTSGIADILSLEDRVIALHGTALLITWSREHGSVDTVSIAVEAPDVRGARPVALARRKDATWVAFDRFLVAVRDGGSIEVLSSQDEIDGGGPLFVDHEGSLWMGSFSALLQFPEPDTRVWNERDGLPSRHVRFLARAGNTVWVSTWQGLGRISAGPDRTTASTVSEWFTQEKICRDSRHDTMWMSSRRGLVEIGAGGRSRLHARPGRILGCADARAGGVWVSSTAGLLHVTGGRAPREHSRPSVDSSASWEAVLEDRRGRLWLARDGTACNAATADAEWVCYPLGETGKVTSLVELPSGSIWASTMKGGVLRHINGRWEQLAPSRELPTAAIFGLVPSADGSVWILGHGVAQRVAETGDGWETVERLGPWIGLPAMGGSDLLEDEDGRLWITTAYGVAEVPPSARFGRAGAPAVALIEAAVDGRPLDAARSFTLPYDQNRLELRFAALSFRDPTLIRYEVRVPGANSWQRTRGDASFRWSDLRPGRYEVQFRASLDGREWSEFPAAVRFSVQSPWYMQWWASTLFLLLAAAVAYLIYRARVGVLLGLERQRTRIAMDLHDEIGSGLGSIGILAGVLSSPGDGAPSGDRKQRLAREIATTSEQLGEALSDIVWSLDPKTASLQDLALRLTEHGYRLCASDDGPEFAAQLPDQWPSRQLSAAVRRTVLTIGLEALHNAVRHSRAKNVVLRLQPDGGRWWLQIEDDGRGIETAGSHVNDNGRPSWNGGRGLPGMQQRAATIGAELTVQSRSTGGTSVRLRFPLT